jgi:hypothetical protein
MIRNKFKVKDFMLEHAPMIENLKNKRFGLKLPQEMLKIIPNKLMKKMGLEL